MGYQKIHDHSWNNISLHSHREASSNVTFARNNYNSSLFHLIHKNVLHHERRGIETILDNPQEF